MADKKREDGGDESRPNVVHPTRPGAVGSRNSPYRDEHDSDEEAKNLINEMTRKIRGNDVDYNIEK